MPLSKEQKERYYHSTFLKEVGELGQEKLLNSKICVVGCGGLASGGLFHLVSIGVGYITLIDFDKVSLSNLPRQTLFGDSDIGQYKVEAAKRRLEALNKDVHINIVVNKLTKDNASRLISGYDVVIDYTDNFETKFLISDTCKELSIPLLTAGVRDYQGQVSLYIPNKSQDFKSLFSILPIDIDQKYIDLDQGIYPFSVGVIGQIASSEVVKYLLNIGDLLINKMIVINLLDNHYQIIKFPK